jgi:hypothetical protein
MQTDHESDSRSDAAEYNCAGGGAGATRAILVRSADAYAESYSDSHANRAANRGITSSFAFAHKLNARDIFPLNYHGWSI